MMFRAPARALLSGRHAGGLKPPQPLIRFHSTVPPTSTHHEAIPIITKVPVKKVILYKHGVGVFERQCVVDNSAKLKLSFRNTEMNDMLKTIHISERPLEPNANGTVSNIEYESRPDPQKDMNDIAISLAGTADKTMAGLLPQLKGVSVELQTTDSRTIRGVVMGIESKNTKTHSTTIDEHNRHVTKETINARDFVTLLCEQGTPTSTYIQAAELTDINKLTILDSHINADMARLLEIMRSTKKNTLKDLMIHVKGHGKREVTASYIVDAPVWKATYKLSLNSNAEIPSKIFGAALVDNLQEEPWENVKLSLVSGFPISFRFDLYAPRYRRRPFFGHPEDGSPSNLVSPMEYTPYMPPPVQFSATSEGFGVAKKSSSPDRRKGPSAAAESARGGGGGGGGGGKGRNVPRTDSDLAKAGDFCKWDIAHPINVNSHGSAVVPFLESEFEGRRVSVFDSTVRRSHPMTALFFKNTTGSQIETGPACVDEDGIYVGEVMLDNIQSQEEKFIPYAIDQAVHVDVEQMELLTAVEVPHNLVLDRMILTIFTNHVTKNKYSATNTSVRPVELFIDHHRISDKHEIDESLGVPYESMTDMVRYRLQLAPHERQRELIVKERKEQKTRYNLTQVMDDIQLYPRNTVLFDMRLVPTENKPAVREFEEALNKLRDLTSFLNEEKTLLKEGQEREKKALSSIALISELNKSESVARQSYADEIAAARTILEGASKRVRALQKEIADIKKDQTATLANVQINVPVI